MFYLVPTPTVNVSAPSTQIVGQSLMLQCNGSIVSSINVPVDIVWSDSSGVIRRMNNVVAITINNSSVYTDSYTISQLNTTDESRIIQCEVVINANPTPVNASDSITLDVTGK